MIKICSKCKENKELNEYYKHALGKNGRRSECKSCSNARSKKYNIEHKQKMSEYTKKYRIEHKQQISKYAKKYHAEHQQRISKRKKEYYKTEKGRLAKTEYRNSEKGRLVEIKGHAKYHKTEKGKLTIIKKSHNRRTNESNVINNLTAQQKNIIIFLQNYRCIGGCDRYFDEVKPTLDHIKPVSKGGSLVKDNVQFLCKKHNSKKHDKEIDYRSDIHKEMIAMMI